MRPFEIGIQSGALQGSAHHAANGAQAQAVLREFADRHQRLRVFFLQRFEQLRDHLITDQRLSEARQLLLGAFFSQEYSLEAAALFNPSMVPHPDQSDLPEGSVRFVLSLREGHAFDAVHAADAVCFLSGPEGGLSDAEESAARRAGFTPRSLGPRVLRADTAPLAVLAALALHDARSQ